MGHKRKVFKLTDLAFVRPAPPPDDPPLRLGDWCRLNSGGPSMLVVDVETETVTVAWPLGKKVVEADFPRVCVRRVKEEG